MKIVIDEDTCKKNRLDIPLVCAIIFLNLGKSYDNCITELKNRGIINETESLFGKQYSMPLVWRKKISEILIDSQIGKDEMTDERIKNLTTDMRTLFPKGLKPGTNTYWRGNEKDIQYKLKKFLLKYDNKYSNEQILNATKAYINRFQTDTTLMRTLQYFIMKDGESDLATILENPNEDGSFDDTSFNYDSSEIVL